ncbi:MAG: EamA family transporter [Candidatus Limnocylindrales bacterium]
MTALPAAGAWALALASALGYGTADFAGGLASRNARVLRVVAAAVPARLLVNLLLLPILGADWSAPAVAWGAGSGLASAGSFALLYETLALGPMSVLSPLTAVISAVIPVVVGLLEGERLGTAAMLGLLAAVLAIVLVGGGPAAESGRPSRVALVLGMGAGVAIAAQLICLHQAPAESGLAPLVAASAASSSVVLGAFLVLRRHVDSRRPHWPLALGSGALSACANLAFLLAVRSGELAIVAVITALFPAVTVLLARLVLRERLHPTQVAGLAAAALAVSLLARA